MITPRKTTLFTLLQGMGYLHAKRIIHKDLKTKNIFFDRDKVVITDFGLFNVTKLCDANRYLSLVMRKPVIWVCDQVRLKPACSADETS